MNCYTYLVNMTNTSKARAIDKLNTDVRKRICTILVAVGHDAMAVSGVAAVSSHTMPYNVIASQDGGSLNDQC